MISKNIFVGILLATSPTIAESKSLGNKPGEMMGSWEVETITDGFSDKTRGIAHTALGQGSSFIIKCDSQGPGSLYISFFTDSYLGSDRIGSRYQFHAAKYRLDDAPPESLPNPYYDGKVASILGGKSPTEFLNLLIQRDPKRFRAQFVTYDSNFADIDIDVTGIASAIRRTAAICLDTKISTS